MIDEQTNARINAILDYLGDITKQGIDFASDQIPQLAREVAIYGAIRGWTGVVLCLIAIGFAAWVAKWCIKMIPKSDGASVMGLTVVLFVGVYAVISLMENADNAIKATFAPRVYLVEYVADLAKGRP